jgi:hypothetical protein
VIGSVASATEASVTVPASTSVSAATLHIGSKTIDGLHPIYFGHRLAMDAIAATVAAAN